MESSRCSSLADNVDENQGTAAQVKQLPQQVNTTVDPNAEVIKPLRPSMRDDIQRILTCTISGDIMQDPVFCFHQERRLIENPCANACFIIRH